MLAPATAEAWPPDYVELFAWRQRQLIAMRKDASLLYGAKEFYRHNPVEFICDWVDTYDPRNAGKKGLLTRMPFVLFNRQRELVQFVVACLTGDNDGLIEKCRDAGVTWVCVGLSVWLWLFWPGIAIGWGSRKEQYVDKLGVIDSIFEKIRVVIRGLPAEFLPVGFNDNDHLTYMRVINPETDAVIVGEAGDNIGRGGRTRIYFKDESAHYERPELIEAALGDNTRVQIDISSVNGTGNVFHRKREAGVDWEGGATVPGKTNVFVFDWRDHPDKDQAWYDARRKKADEEGLLHKFAQEVDRDYASAVEGIIIKPEWVQAAMDAHIKLGIEESGSWMTALDVADEGGDLNCHTARRGIILKDVEAWGEGDVGETARRSVHKASPLKPKVTMQYDCIGVGAGVKAETNRLRKMKEMPATITVIPWNAGSSPLNADQPVIKGDKDSPLNGDYYSNLKAQGWWELGRRFFRTWQAVVEGKYHDPDTLISIDTKSISKKELRALAKELSQATSGLTTGSLKIKVNKAPKGTKSPNRADSVVMNYFPVGTKRYTLENL